jgi:hypothetical protein
MWDRYPNTPEEATRLLAPRVLARAAEPSTTKLSVTG